MSDLVTSVLFSCDHNAVRSPMAEGLMKKFYGRKIYVQSAGVMHDFEIDGFAIAVCGEIGVELERHRSRSFDEMEKWGDAIGGFDLIVALSEAANAQALDYARSLSVNVEYWPIIDPTMTGTRREEKLAAYRDARDQIIVRIHERFGEPMNGEGSDG